MSKRLIFILPSSCLLLGDGAPTLWGMATLTVPFLVCVVGLLLYLIATPANPRLARIGEIMFFCGLLVTLFGVSAESVRLFR